MIRRLIKENYYIGQRVYLIFSSGETSIHWYYVGGIIKKLYDNKALVEYEWVDQTGINDKWKTSTKEEFIKDLIVDERVAEKLVKKWNGSNFESKKDNNKLIKEVKLNDINFGYILVNKMTNNKCEVIAIGQYDLEVKSLNNSNEFVIPENKLFQYKLLEESKKDNNKLIKEGINNTIKTLIDSWMFQNSSKYGDTQNNPTNQGRLENDLLNWLNKKTKVSFNADDVLIYINQNYEVGPDIYESKKQIKEEKIYDIDNVYKTLIDELEDTMFRLRVKEYKNYTKNELNEKCRLLNKAINDLIKIARS